MQSDLDRCFYVETIENVGCFYGAVHPCYATRVSHPASHGEFVDPPDSLKHPIIIDPANYVVAD